MKRSDGKYYEQLVHLIEQSIDPAAAVEHDVKLPIIGSSSGAAAQCDLVIRTGRAPRQTTTIVEVQDRKTQVSPNDFRGWEQKRQEVGAQHLICVSRQLFPKSIQEKARNSGGTIRLITLREPVANNIPIHSLNISFEVLLFEVTKIENLESYVSKKSLEASGIIFEDLRRDKISVGEKLYSWDKVQLFSLSDLAIGIIQESDREVSGSGVFRHDIDSEEKLYLHVGEKYVPVGLSFDFEWKKSIYEAAPTNFVYEQTEHGVLGWICTATVETPIGLYEWKVPVLPHDEGNYAVPGIQFKAPTDRTTLSLTVKPSTETLE